MPQTFKSWIVALLSLFSHILRDFIFQTSNYKLQNTIKCALSTYSDAGCLDSRDYEITLSSPSRNYRRRLNSGLKSFFNMSSRRNGRYSWYLDSFLDISACQSSQSGRKKVKSPPPESLLRHVFAYVLKKHREKGQGGGEGEGRRGEKTGGEGTHGGREGGRGEGEEDKDKRCPCSAKASISLAKNLLSHFFPSGYIISTNNSSDFLGTEKLSFVIGFSNSFCPCVEKILPLVPCPFKPDCSKNLQEKYLIGYFPHSLLSIC